MSKKRTQGILMIAAFIAAAIVVKVIVVSVSAYKGRSAVERVRTLGGKVTYSGSSRMPKVIRDVCLECFEDVIEISLASSTTTDQDLARMRALFPTVRILHLDGTEITDRGLQELRRATDLQTLRVSSTAITGEGFAHLTGLRDLIFLDLRNCSIEDDNLKHIGQFSKLQTLFIANNELSDEGLLFIHDLQNLENLDLSRNKVTDEGLAALVKSLRRLQILNLTDTAVSERTIDRLERARPKLIVRRGWSGCL